jgi:diaminopimelate decarboxylase
MYLVFWVVLILLKLLGTRLRYKIVSRALGLVMEKKQRNRKIPSIERYAEEITATLRSAFKKHGIDPRGMALQIEPGRSLYGNASVHLSRVLSTKHQTAPIAYNWVILDTSYFFMTGGVIEQNFYNFLVANKADAKAVKIADICGKSCFADRLIPEVRIPEIVPGDVIAVLDAGAYQENSASNFNSMPRPASVMVRGDTAALIKRAETLKDIFARDIIPKKMIRVV